MSLRIYHYKRCSKSRQALSLIQSIGSVTVIDYHQNPPTKGELKDLMERSNHPPVDFIRLNRDIPLDRDSSMDDIINFLVLNSDALQRPIVDDGQTVAIARPLENLKDIPACSGHFPV